MNVGSTTLHSNQQIQRRMKNMETVKEISNVIPIEKYRGEEVISEEELYIDPSVVEYVSPQRFKKALARKRRNKRMNAIAVAIAYMYAACFVVVATIGCCILIAAVFNPSAKGFIIGSCATALILVLITTFSLEYIEDRIYSKNR